MSILTLPNLKAYLREISADLDLPLEMARAAAVAEANAFCGVDLDAEFADGAPGDVVMACCLLAQAHADPATPDENEYRRGAAQKLLFPYRRASGVASA
ncbi:hypothetical protein [Luteimonas aquatica]|uniref:hypothetical protein n=1 Tax=Luteimonas aquatica TaxID=450364 RepID=UPI001F56F637|nr:hypothetical protein [Luteimonas aquatica]